MHIVASPVESPSRVHLDMQVGQEGRQKGAVPWRLGVNHGKHGLEDRAWH